MRPLFRPLDKKGQAFNGLMSLGVGIAGLVIIMAVVFLVLSQTRAQIIEVDNITNLTNTSSFTTAFNATNTLTDAAADIPGWVPLIVIASIGLVLLGLVALYRTR